MNKSGYDWNIFVDQDDVEDFSCSLCSNVLNNPVTTPNGCEFCIACAERFTSLEENKDAKMVCPKCFSEVFRRDQFYRSKSSADFINSQECKCPNVSCLWRGTVAGIDAHLRLCTALQQSETKMECEKFLGVCLCLACCSASSRQMKYDNISSEDDWEKDSFDCIEV